MNNNRLKNIRGAIKNPILIKKKENLFYLTGRSFNNHAEEFLLVLPLTPALSRSTFAKATADKKGRGSGAGLVGFGGGLEKITWVKKVDRLKNIGKYLAGAKKLDIEYGFTYGEGKYLKNKLQVTSGKLQVRPERSPVDFMRQVKEPEEIALVKKSMQIVEKVFELVKKEIKKTGMTEIKLAKFIETAGLKIGAEDVSFPAIVASGANAAIPHHVPSTKQLKSGESIIIDFGFKYKNYCSDFTRTVFLKSAPKRLADAYNQVEKAYNESMEFINSPDPSLEKRGVVADSSHLQKGRRGGVSGNDVYQKAVDILAEKKLDKYFIHSLGHGTGLEIHELPNLSPKSKDVLADNMVFSIEPGVYIPKVGGIRIEDLVYLEKGMVKKFINVPTSLRENII